LAVDSQEKFLDLSNDFLPICRRSLESENIFATAFCHCSDFGSTKKPESPVTSGTPARLHATIGLPQAMASRTTNPKVSIVLGNKKTEHLCISLTTS
jgi:hypothetical protein